MIEFDSRESAAPHFTGSGSAFFFFQSVFEINLCRYCKTLLNGIYAYKPLPTSYGQNRMYGQRSDFEQMTKETLESCSLCFCMRHLLPIDLPESTSMIALAYLKHSLDSIELEMKADGRVLGWVKFDEIDQPEAQNHQPAPVTNFQVVSQLIRECEEGHLHENWNLPRYQSPTSIQLIDVEDMMVISATTRYRYLALSYVWGKHVSFETTSKNIESLCHKGGLGTRMDEIPQTIKDAMDVVRNLGERYLWVDRLCIEQDNTTQKEAHIQKMDVIYSHALITIIAHAGVAATSPLPGLRPGTRLGLPTKRIGNIVMSVHAPSLWESGAPHETRGWTLQEQLLSKRCLYFDFHTTWFQCDKGTCRELDATGAHAYRLLQTPTSFNMHALQSILMGATENHQLGDIWKIYATIVERYRTRELRYATDAVPALQGVARVISESLGVPLISGVPLNMLPRALQFYFDGEGDRPGRNETAPSWSWAGRKDSIFFDDRTVAEPVPFEAVRVDMKVQYRSPELVQPPPLGALQPAGSQKVEGPNEAPSPPAPLYTLLDIECLSTKASAFEFRTYRQAELGHKRRYLERLGSILYVHDQAGKRCGHSLGKPPDLLEEEYRSDQLQWILVSKSQPIRVSLGRALSQLYKVTYED